MLKLAYSASWVVCCALTAAYRYQRGDSTWAAFFAVFTILEAVGVGMVVQQLWP